VATIVSHYVDNRGALLFQAWLGGIAAGLLFPLFLVGLANSIRRAERPAAVPSILVLAAGLLLAVCALMGSAAEGATAYLVVRSTNPAVIQALNDTSRLILTFIWFPITLLAATMALVGVRPPGLSEWYARASGVVAVVTAVASLGVFSLHDPIRPGGGLTYLAFLLFLVWVLVTAVALWLQDEASSAQPVV
jgi:hypothetical protein